MAQPQIRFQVPEQAAPRPVSAAPRAAGEAAVAVASPARALQESVAARLAAQENPDLWPGAARVAFILFAGLAAWGLVAGAIVAIAG